MDGRTDIIIGLPARLAEKERSLSSVGMTYAAPDGIELLVWPEYLADHLFVPKHLEERCKASDLKDLAHRLAALVPEIEVSLPPRSETESFAIIPAEDNFGDDAFWGNEGDEQV